jgi:hypothetical protein
MNGSSTNYIPIPFGIIVSVRPDDPDVRHHGNLNMRVFYVQKGNASILCSPSNCMESRIDIRFVVAPRFFDGDSDFESRQFLKDLPLRNQE